MLTIAYLIRKGQNKKSHKKLNLGSSVRFNFICHAELEKPSFGNKKCMKFTGQTPDSMTTIA